MARTKLGWAVLGTGKIASIFAASLDESLTGRLVAVGSRTLGSGERFAARFPGARSYGSYDEAICGDGVDAVYIATPHTTHLELVAAASAARKHVLCEKPLTVNASQAEQALDAARAGGVALMEGFAFRYHSQTRRLLDLLAEGPIGEPLLLEASFGYDAGPAPDNYLLRRELAGGSILDVGCYPVAMARLIAGAVGGTSFADPEDLRGLGLVDEASAVDVRATATLRFPSGFEARISSAIDTPLDNALRLWGSRGVITLTDPWLPGRLHRATIEIRTPGSGSVGAADSAGEDLYAAEADELAGLLPAPQSPRMSWGDSLGNMRVLDIWRAAVGVRYSEDDLVHASGVPATMLGLEPSDGLPLD